MIPFPECENISSGTANALHVTLLVADDDDEADDADGWSLRDALGPDVVVVDADAVSDSLARHDPDVVVVDADAVADPGGVVSAVRSAGGGSVPVVSVGSAATDADVARTSRDPDALRAAVDRARRVAAYRRSVADLYEQCRDRELGQPDEALRECRADADSRLADVPDDRWAVAAAIRPDPAAEDDDRVDSQADDDGDGGTASDPGADAPERGEDG